MNDEINVDMLKKIAPRSVVPHIDQQYADDINSLINDPDTAEYVRDNMISAQEIARSGKYTFEQYINACKYATWKSMGETNIGAFIKTFPDKYQDWLAQGKSDKEISRYVSGFNKTQCVAEVIKKVSVSFYVQNMDVRQKALMVQAELMISASSEKVRSDAANSVLTHTKPDDEGKGLEVNINLNEESGMMHDLKNTMRQLAQQQQNIIAAGGATAQQVAHSRIIEGESDDISDT